MNLYAVKIGASDAFCCVAKFVNRPIYFLMRHRTGNITILFGGDRGGGNGHFPIEAIGIG